MDTQDKKTATIKLPERLVSWVDLSRVTRELKNLDDWLNQAKLRGGQAVSTPKTTSTLEELAAVNTISLLDKSHRKKLLELLEAFSKQAPKIHMSFAVEPSAVFLNRMIIWLRANISPLILLEIGLQPTIVAGCTVRTRNKLFDMSLRNRFYDQRLELVKSIAKTEEEAKA